MVAAETMSPTFRPALKPLGWALLISVLLHLGAWGIYTLGNHYHLWDRDFMPAWLRRLQRVFVVPVTPKPAQSKPAASPQITLSFVEPSPAAAIAEAPKNATHYSSVNSVAANKEAPQDTGIPNITGSQTHVAKTDDVPRHQTETLRPFVPKPVEKDEPSAEVQPKPAGGQVAGDLTMSHPVTQPLNTPDEAAQEQPRKRPRTIAEAMAQKGITGEMMKQNGGVKHRELAASFDTIATSYGEYDAELIRAIQERWDTLLEQQAYAQSQTGRVVLEFTLHYDGRVTDMVVREHTVDDLYTSLCELAVTDPAPFQAWPTAMRHELDKDYRRITFTFYYE